MMNRVKNDADIKRIRTSGHMLAEVLRQITPATVAGITTAELDMLAATELKRLGGDPAFLGFESYPNVICISVNDEVVHGLPGSRIIRDGDIVGLDFGVNFEGMITDGAITVPVGKVSSDALRLLAGTKESLLLGINAVKAGARLGDIADAIETRLRMDEFGVIEDLSGHGVGDEVHEDPIILNFGTAGTGQRLKAGMTIAIEPMATLGGPDIVVDSDGWTIRTADGSLGAQFEHTVLVTESGSEILTV
jgi:methionyl aminopeptidase